MGDRRVGDDSLFEHRGGRRRERCSTDHRVWRSEMRRDLDQPVAVDAVGVDQQLAARRNKLGDHTFVRIGRTAWQRYRRIGTFPVDQSHHVGARVFQVGVELAAAGGAIAHHRRLHRARGADRTRGQQQRFGRVSCHCGIPSRYSVLAPGPAEHAATRRCQAMPNSVMHGLGPVDHSSSRIASGCSMRGTDSDHRQPVQRQRTGAPSDRQPLLHLWRQIGQPQESAKRRAR
jgi:hypothetical protein